MKPFFYFIKAAIVVAVILAIYQVVVLCDFLTKLSYALNNSIGAFSDVFAFSLAEIIILCVPLFIVFLLVSLVRAIKRRKKWLYLKRLISFALILFIFYNITVGFSYHNTSLIKNMGLEQNEITDENIAAAADFYIGKANEFSSLIERRDGAVFADYDFNLLSGKILDLYDAAALSFLNARRAKAKAIRFSAEFSYTGIIGIYFPFTAEVNINVNVPSIDLPALLAHEYAHSKGVMREDEANFLSKYLLMTSTDPYIAYGGYVFSAISVINMMYLRDENEAKAFYEKLSEPIRAELSLRSKFFEKYEGTISAVSEFFNNLYLIGNGISGGVKSYSYDGVCLVNLYVKTSK
jgi:hypothetical protein